MDIAAFVVACFGFLVATLSLGWQIASWALDGRRVKVTLKHCAMGRCGVVVGPVLRSGANALIESIRAIGRSANKVYMSAELGTGEERRTSTSLQIANG